MDGIVRNGNSFQLGEGPSPLARIDFVLSPSQGLVIEHTEVDPSLKGQGLGARLVAAVAALARAEGLGLWATCPYALKVIEGDAAYADLLRRPCL